MHSITDSGTAPDSPDFDADLQRLERALTALFGDPSSSLWQTIDFRLRAAIGARAAARGTGSAIDLLAGILLTVVLTAMLVGFWTLMLSVTTGTHILR